VTEKTQDRKEDMYRVHTQVLYNQALWEIYTLQTKSYPIF